VCVCVFVHVCLCVCVYVCARRGMLIHGYLNKLQIPNVF